MTMVQRKETSGLTDRVLVAIVSPEHCVVTDRGADSGGVATVRLAQGCAVTERGFARNSFADAVAQRGLLTGKGSDRYSNLVSRVATEWRRCRKGF